MKKRLLIFIAILFSGAITFGAGLPLTGNIYIPTAGAYTSIKMAIDSLNIDGVGAGGVNIYVAAGYTETFPTRTSGLITTTTSTAANPVLFKKFGTGANPKITAGTGTGAGTGTTDYIICIGGTDYITFDGIDLQENPSNSSTTTWFEWGYAILRATTSDGSQYVTIKNCTISLNKANANTYGIYSNRSLYTAPATSISPISTAGANSNNAFYNNTITNSCNGIALFGGSAANYYDQNNDIGSLGGNKITNFGSTVTTTTVYGINTTYQPTMTIANNKISGAITGSTFYGMYLQSGACNASIFGDTVSVQLTTNTGSFYGIYDAMSYLAGGVVNVHDNVVTGCAVSSTAASYSGTCYYYNVGHASSNFNFYNNKCTNNTYGSVTNTATGSVYYMFTAGFPTVMGTANFYGNTITGNTRVQSVIGGGNTYYFSLNMQSVTTNLYNNYADNNTAATNGTAYGFYNTTANGTPTKNIYGNTFTNLSGANGTVYGMSLSGGSTVNIYKNKVQNLSTATTSAAALAVSGISVSSLSGSSTVYIYDNVIGDLRAPASAYTSAITGLDLIYAQPSNYIGCYNNSVYINATSSAANFGTAGVTISEYPLSLDFRNNIICNNSTPKGTGIVCAILNTNTNTSLTNLSSLCNNNNYYAGTPGASNLIYYDGVKGDRTLLAYQARVFPKEGSSVTEIPPFMSTTSGSMNLHVNPAIASQSESSGTVISTPVAITTDFDGDATYPNSGYPNNLSYPATAPDMGADEFGGIPLDQTPPTIRYTQLLNTGFTTNRTLNATITDASGVPASGTGLPRVGWKTNYNGTWNYVAGSYVSGNQYTFSFGAGTTIGDTVYYYVLAQDLHVPANVVCFPFNNVGGLTANPPLATTPPDNAYKYVIIPPICGTLTVGTTGTYPTLTAAFADINSKGITCPTTLLLIDPLYSSLENFPLTLNTNDGSSAVNTLTIRPQAGVTAKVSGSSTSDLIKLNGFSYLVIDGSNSGGTDMNLTLQNTLAANGSHVIGVYSNGTTTPATNLTVKNTKVRGIATTSTTTCGVWFDGTNGGYNDCVITHDSINSLYTGIQYYGSNNATSSNLHITNNIIGAVDTAKAVSFRGIVLKYADNTLIEGNEIMGIAMGDTVGKQGGIFMLTAATNTKIRKNRIHDWYHTRDIGLGAWGIRFEAEASTVTEISNNEIYNIKSSGAAPGPSLNNPYGISIYSGGNIRILNNSIFLSGEVLSGSDMYDASSACIGIYNIGATNIEIRNNILKNSMVGLHATGCSLDGKTFAIYAMAATASNFSIIDNNDYFVDGCSPHIGGFFGSYNNTYSTLAQWQAATGQDAHSINVDPAFVSMTHLVPTAAGMDHKGAYLSEVPSDINNVTRANPPDMGAYEFTAYESVVTDPATSLSINSAVLNGNVNANGSSIDVYFDYGLTDSYGTTVSASPSTITGFGSAPVTASISGLLPSTTYHFRARGIDAGSVTIFGNDRTFTTSENLKTFNLTLYLEGLYNGTGTMNQASNGTGPKYGTGIADQVTIEFHDASTYGTLVHTFSSVDLHTDGTASLTVPGILSGSYYVTVKNRNSIATVSATPVAFPSGTIAYNFSDNVNKAYGSNLLLLEDGKCVIYGGDVNQDDIIDGGDMSGIDNQAAAFASGYIPEDCNGDGLVDGSDLAIVDNNAAAFVGAVTP